MSLNLISAPRGAGAHLRQACEITRMNHFVLQQILGTDLIIILIYLINKAIITLVGSHTSRRINFLM